MAENIIKSKRKKSENSASKIADIGVIEPATKKTVKLENVCPFANAKHPSFEMLDLISHLCSITHFLALAIT